MGRTKKKILQTVGEGWRQFKSDLTRKGALAADKDNVNDSICEKYNISMDKWAQFCQSHRDPSWDVCNFSFLMFMCKNSVIIIHCVIRC